MTLHGSSGNASRSVPRRGWSIRMCGDKETYYNRPSTRDPDAPALEDGQPVLHAELYPNLWP